MTTIAFCGNSIAYDSRTSHKTSIITDSANKHERVIDMDFFCTGPVADIHVFKAYLCKNRSSVLNPLEKHVMPRELNLEVLLVRDKEVYYIEVTDIIKAKPLEHRYAIGSGALWATAALDFNKSALEAVQYACSKDKSTGGNVTEFKIGASK